MRDLKIDELELSQKVEPQAVQQAPQLWAALPPQLDGTMLRHERRLTH
jgi:hypothetical protein